MPGLRELDIDGRVGDFFSFDVFSYAVKISLLVELYILGTVLITLFAVPQDSTLLSLLVPSPRTSSVSRCQRRTRRRHWCVQ